MSRSVASLGLSTQQGGGPSLDGSFELRRATLIFPPIPSPCPGFPYQEGAREQLCGGPNAGLHRSTHRSMPASFSVLGRRKERRSACFLCYAVGH